MNAILKFDFPKKRTITSFWSKLSNLHKKDPILHVATTFSPKTRGNKNKPWTHSTPVKSTWHFSLKYFYNLIYMTFHIITTGVHNFISWRAKGSSQIYAQGPNEHHFLSFSYMFMYSRGDQRAKQHWLVGWISPVACLLSTLRLK